MIEGEVQAIYDQTAEFFRSVSQDFPAGEYRAYEILYGPPAVAAPVMFIGFQPGGDGAEYVAPSTWDERCVSAHADWPLASRLRANER